MQSKTFITVIVIVVLLGLGGWYWVSQPASDTYKQITTEPDGQTVTGPVEESPQAAATKPVTSGGGSSAVVDQSLNTLLEDAANTQSSLNASADNSANSINADSAATADVGSL